MTERLRPVLIVIAGPNGSGKTTVTRQLREHKAWLAGVEVINPDEIAQQRFGDWNAPADVRKAARAAASERESLLAKGRSLAFETVFSASDKIDFILRAKAVGYFVRFLFVSTDHPAINASRVARRVMEGGHTVPIEKIVARYAKSIANAAAILPHVDRGYVFDNSREDSPVQLMFRRSVAASRRPTSSSAMPGRTRSGARWRPDAIAEPRPRELP